MGQEGERGVQPQQRPELSNKSTLREMQQVEAGRELADFIHRADALQSDLYAAESKQPIDPLDVSGDLPLEPPLRDRYSAADLLMRGVIAILRDEIAGASPLTKDAGYLKEKLDYALGAYGLKVVDDEHGEAKEYQQTLQANRRLLRESQAGASQRHVQDDGTQRSIVSPQDDGGRGTRR
jgi:hypothetical protein